MLTLYDHPSDVIRSGDMWKSKRTDGVFARVMHVQDDGVVVRMFQGGRDNGRYVFSASFLREMYHVISRI